MSDLERLLDGEADPIERSLLEAAKDEDEERVRTERTLAALGLGGPGPGPGPGGGGAGGATAGGASATGAVLKWLAIAAVGGGLAVALVARRTGNPAPAPSAPAVVTTEKAAPPALSAAPAESVAAPTAPKPAASAATPAPHRVPSAPVATKAPPPPKPTGPSDLKREIAALDRARSALREGDTARAKKELDRYDYEFPFGSLAPEAAALRARLQKMSGHGKK